MGRINVGRVILGGLVAGLVVNVGEFIFNGVLVADTMEAAMTEMETAYASWAMPVFIVTAFVMGIFLVWLYAAIRPRFGAGPRTAILAGLAVWVAAGLFPYIGLQATGIFPGSVLGWSLVWVLFEYPIATLAGAALYQEPADVVSEFDTEEGEATG